MIYPPEMLDILQSAVVSAWEGTVPSGARWNEPPVAAIYTSRKRETALAEANYYIALQPLRPKAKRMLYTIRVSLNSVIDLSAPAMLARLGITMEVLESDDHAPCRLIGSAVSWLGHDGLLVSSARRVGGTNLVIYRQDLPTRDFEVTAEELIAADERS